MGQKLGSVFTIKHSNDCVSSFALTLHSSFVIVDDFHGGSCFSQMVAMEGARLQAFFFYS